MQSLCSEEKDIKRDCELQELFSTKGLTKTMKEITMGILRNTLSAAIWIDLICKLSFYLLFLIYLKFGSW